MSPVELLDHESADQELSLLIEEARRRQRRRHSRRALTVLAASAIAILTVLAATGAFSPTAHPAVTDPPALRAATDCPTSPARLVSNSAFGAIVLGRGRVRLAIGNQYLNARRRVVLGTTGTPGWSAIEAIWVVNSGYKGTVVVRGKRLGKPGAIAVQSAWVSAGQAPGVNRLVLPPSSANTGPGLRLYPAVVWVRAAGCYAMNVTGPGLGERIVFGALAHQ